MSLHFEIEVEDLAYEITEPVEFAAVLCVAYQRYEKNIRAEESLLSQWAERVVEQESIAVRRVVEALADAGAPLTPMAISPRDFRDIFAVMMNLDMDELEDAGVITKGNFDNGGSSWKRFNDDPLRFVLKLDDQKLDALTALVNKRRRAK